MSPTAPQSATVIETKLGYVALAWTAEGLTRLALPEKDRARADRHVQKWAEAALAGGGSFAIGTGEEPVPGFVHQACGLIRRYGEGETVDFTPLPLDLDGIDPFRRAIYAAALRLRQGEVVTYGELAERAGFPRAARETGAALGRNPLPLVVPCHRIVAAGGKIGGFSAPGGSVTKERLLAHEGVSVGPPPPAQASFGF